MAGSDDIENPDEMQTRALKRPRLVWTAQLHQRFVDAVKQLGLKNAVPKTIMQARLPTRLPGDTMVMLEASFCKNLHGPYRAMTKAECFDLEYPFKGQDVLQTLCICVERLMLLSNAIVLPNDHIQADC